MPTVAARILTALAQRLQAINGRYPYATDVEQRVLLRRPSYDWQEGLPAVFVYRKPSETQRRGLPNSELGDTTVSFGVAGVVRVEDNCAVTIEAILGDIHRALELPNDLYLRDRTLGRNLLNQPLLITAIDTAPAQDALPFDIVEVTVQCTYPQKYGDPDYVQP